jgi:hypothetical protein
VSDIDPIQALLSLGLLSQEVIDGAARVSPNVASTRAGRLIAAGADPTTLLEQLSQLSGIPLAPREMLESARPVDMPVQTLSSLRGFMACPVHIDASGTADIVVADPEGKLGVESVMPTSRLYLAQEVDVRILFAKLDALAKEPALRDVGKRVEKPWEPPSDAQKVAAVDVDKPKSAIPPPMKREMIGVTSLKTDEHPNIQRRAFLRGVAAGAGTMLLVCVVVGAVLWPREHEIVVEDKSARQLALVNEARTSLTKGDSAWAASKCSDAIELDATTLAAAEAFIICGKAKLALGDPTARDDLQRALKMLPDGDPLRAEAELALRPR